LTIELFYGSKNWLLYHDKVTLFCTFKYLMIKYLFKDLILTFIISSLIATIALAIDHHFSDFLDFDSDLYGMITFAVGCYVILTILSLPALLLAYQRIRQNPWLRFIFYYIGPAIPLIMVTLKPIIHEGKYAEDWLCTIIFAIFVFVRAVFYIKLTKKNIVIA
jgi:hypothetical protein